VVNHIDARLAEIAARLDRFADVPTDVLADIVVGHGACDRCLGEGDPPTPTNPDTADAELSAWLCADCPVRDHCLELEFRWMGPSTVGVWGGLSEQDRHALYPVWLARRAGRDENGGESS
jgi:WhiB family redox-sensing transcriptional regulator